MKRIKTMLSLVLAAAMLSACFGAGASGTGNSDEAAKAGLCVPAARCVSEFEPSPAAQGAGRLGANGPQGSERDVFVFASLINENFEPSSSLDGWWMYDGDGDGETWRWSKDQAEYAYNGTGFMFSLSFNVTTSLDTDNWLVTPEVTIPSSGYYLSFYGMSRSESFKDHVQVLVGRRGEAFFGNGQIHPDRWETVMDLTELPESYTQFLVDLSAYAGSAISIAIRHKEDEQLAVMIDKLQVGYAEVVDVEAVDISRSALSLRAAESAWLTAKAEPADAFAPGLLWSTSDPSVAVVNKAGGVLAMGPGTAVITASATNGVSSSCTVTVTEGHGGFDASGLTAFGILDLDDGSEPNAWYGVGESGIMSMAHSGGGAALLLPAWHPVDGVIYAFRANSDETYDFVRIDPSSFSVTKVASDVPVPWWMSYDYDNNVMYGGYMGFDSDDGIDSFEIAGIDLSSGRKAGVLMDVYRDPYTDGEGVSHTEGAFLPLYCTYAGGAFIGADHQYNDLISFRPSPDGSGFTAIPVGTTAFSREIGGISSFTQGLYYDPVDGMLYWNYVNTASVMVVADLETGVACETGVCGPHGAHRGIETSGLFCVYSLPRPAAGYNANDYFKLRAFLECADEFGVSNGKKINSGYDPDVPKTWRGAGVTISWARIGGEYRLVSLDVGGKGLAGSLDLSGCTELTSLNCADNGIERLSVEGCASLGYLYAQNNSLTSMNLRCCPDVFAVNCENNRLGRIDMRGSYLLWPGVLSAGEGGAVEYCGFNGGAAEAKPAEGMSFVGWFDPQGELVSTQERYDPAGYPGSELTARFDGSFILYGDANMDGELGFADISVIFSIITGAVECSGEQIAISDFNRDDQLSFGDVSDLYGYLIQ